MGTSEPEHWPRREPLLAFRVPCFLLLLLETGREQEPGTKPTSSDGRGTQRPTALLRVSSRWAAPSTRRAWDTAGQWTRSARRVISTTLWLKRTGRFDACALTLDSNPVPLSEGSPRPSARRFSSTRTLTISRHSHPATRAHVACGVIRVNMWFWHVNCCSYGYSAA